MNENLQKYWDEFIFKFGLYDDVEAYNSIVNHYSESHRRYHTLRHLEECFDILKKTGDLENVSLEFWLALWLHDIVYDPAENDNEAQSAAMSTWVLHKIGVPYEKIGSVISLIMNTKHHDAEPWEEGAILVDVDLAILGSSPERFQEYENQIRAEYSFVPQEMYDFHRNNIMKGFAQREPIFKRQNMRDMFEEQAKQNLSRYLK